jgi:hypothetical protein
MPEFGNTTEQATSNVGWDDWQIITLATLPVNANVSKISLYCSNDGASHAACKLKGIIYENTGGEPVALLATGDEMSMPDSQGLGWFDLTFTPSVALVAADYWIGFIASTAAAGFTMKYLVSGGSPASKASGDVYSNGAVNPMTGTHTYAYYWSIKGTYEASFPDRSSLIQFGIC